MRLLPQPPTQRPGIRVVHVVCEMTRGERPSVESRISRNWSGRPNSGVDFNLYRPPHPRVVSQVQPQTAAHQAKTCALTTHMDRVELTAATLWPMVAMSFKR